MRFGVSSGCNAHWFWQRDAGCPKMYNIEMDPHEYLIVGGLLYGWVSQPALKSVTENLKFAKKYPNPPAPNITEFKSDGK